MIALALVALLVSTPPLQPPGGPSASQPSPQATSAPAPTPEPALSPPPTPPPPTPATPAPLPTTVPLPSPSPTPPLYAYVMTYPPPATATTGPVITQVSLNDRTIHAGGPLMIQVTTSANVVGVEARCFGRYLAIPQVGPGLFALNYTLPTAIPAFLFRTFDIVIAAATPDGQQTTKDFALTLAH